MLDPDDVDLAELGAARDDRTPGSTWWIDPATGRIRAVPAHEDEPAGWRRIPPMEAGEGYGDMRDFVEAVQHRRAAELLDQAIDGRGAFRRFKNALFEFPEVRDEWYRFRDARARRGAVDWLLEEGLIDEAAANRARARYPDPSPRNADVPAAVAADLADLYGPRLHRVLLYGSWASGEGGVESDLDLLVVLDKVDSTWAELDRMDAVLWQHTERTGLTITALPVAEAAMGRPTEPMIIRAKVGSVRIT
ncbi:UPF0158 family protein [Pseudonocardia benzenivorans]|jgi:predicted nucleotidyltransferase|uniref:Polymerase nucleotidyl transferase domain-containing protein n=2 Tax=Pseudonocardia TaxID=1847 RepID=F4CXU8_PSEUX|nr:UPF0158 family protein [Pseudonocardia dioxanivorans]AEA28754.1 protein of unknown function UPF0158 [Pseudonocardia dioxanivorans CB1190]GJF01613.1 hypothetical protein PSD17_05770 [Pseudonocardia sp. D17]